MVLVTHFSPLLNIVSTIKREVQQFRFLNKSIRLVDNSGYGGDVLMKTEAPLTGTEGKLIVAG